MHEALSSANKRLSTRRPAGENQRSRTAARSGEWASHQAACRAAKQAGVQAGGGEQERGARRRNPQARMVSPVTHVEQFERFLLRRGVGALEADRNRCADCGRTPLTGEQVHLYDGRKHGIVCELCRTLRREAPVASETVRHYERGQTVRLTARAA
ncbi:MAG: hypothetical protein ACHP93_05255 [Solirubrobacterales bacterium]